MADIPRFEIPPQMRALAESGIEQARQAFGGFMGVAKRGAAAMQGAGGPMAPGADLYARGLESADRNVQAAFDHAQKLARAGSLQEAMELQIDYVRGQFAALQAQAKEFSGLAQGAMQRGADEAARTAERTRDGGG